MKNKAKTRVKRLTRKAMLANINGLSLGDRAYCGPYGTVTCVRAAGKGGRRLFSVSGTDRLPKRRSWTIGEIREAVEAR